MPWPDLARMDPVVRDHLTQARASVAAVLEAPTSSDAERGSAVGELGRIYLAYEILDAAGSAFEQARALAPDAVDWPYYLGVLDELDGLPEAAAARFLEVLALHPGWLPAELRLARVDLSRGDLVAAESRFRAVLERHPDSAAAKYGLGQIATLQGDPATAVELLREVTAAQPEATAASYQLGLAYRALGERDKARALLARQGREPVRFDDPLFDDLATLMRGTSMFVVLAAQSRAAGNLETAVRAYKLALAQDPDLLDARLALADVLVETGATEAAIVELRNVITRAPEDVSGHYNLGTLLGRLGRRAEAKQRLVRALALDPDHADAHVNLAGLLGAEGRFAEAAGHYEEALRLDPQDRQSQIQRALIWTRLERAQEALADLQALRLQAPGDPEVVLALGQVLAFMGRDAEAREALLKISPAADNAARASAEYQLGLIALRSGDGEAAREHLNTALAQEPRLAEAHVQLATLDGQQGRFSTAADHFAAALEITPGDLQSRIGRTVALLLAERYADALAHLEASLTVAPDSAELEDALARLLATCPDPALRDGARALALAQQVIQAEPDFEHARTVAMAMAELGRYEEAAAWQQQIIRRAGQAGRDDLVPALRAHLKLYQRGEPVRAPWLGG